MGGFIPISPPVITPLTQLPLVLTQMSDNVVVEDWYRVQRIPISFMVNFIIIIIAIFFNFKERLALDTQGFVDSGKTNIFLFKYIGLLFVNENKIIIIWILFEFYFRKNYPNKCIKYLYYSYTIHKHTTFCNTLYYKVNFRATL